RGEPADQSGAGPLRQDGRAQDLRGANRTGARPRTGVTTSDPSPSPSFMQAIVKEKRAPGLTVTTVPKPSAGPGEVLIRVRHAGVCGTDLHIADWDAWAQGRIKPPVVVGHEFAGEIVTLGEGVTELKIGQDRKSTRLNSSHVSI